MQRILDGAVRMFLLRTVVLLACVVAVPAEGFLRVCYYSNAAQYRPVPARLTPDKIDPNICTHLVYAFAKVDEKSELNFSEYNDEEMVKVFNGLKRRNPSLVTLLAVGGYNQGATSISKMADDADLRSNFVRKAVEFIQQSGFDGLSLDWQFTSGTRADIRRDRRNFVLLLKELRQAMESSNKKMWLSTAVPADKAEIDSGYDVSNMVMYLDFISLMSYDIHGHWERNAEHNSPLFAREDEIEGDRQKNVNWAANYWVSRGVTKEKLIIGLSTYARSYTLARRTNNEIGAPISQAGTLGPFTKEYGFLAYYEVCEDVTKGITRWDDEQKVKYLVYRDQWIGYDDEMSFEHKLNYIKDNEYGGAMVWSLDLDDFNQQCVDSTQPFALVSLMKEQLGEYSTETTTGDKEGDTNDGGHDYASNYIPDNEDTGVENNKDYKRVCYFENWARYRKGQGTYTVNDIDPKLCTHLIYSFAKMENNELALIESNEDKMIADFNGLKATKSGLKTLIALGGGVAGSKAYSTMVSSANSRGRFVSSSVTFLRKWDFDGLDLDWEYPTVRGGRASDKNNFIKLIKELDDAFVKEARDTSQPKLILTAAVAVGKRNIDKAYNIPEMAKYLDFINLMAYNFHGHWDGYVGHNSPLFARSDERNSAVQFNTDWAARYWVSKGASPEKLIIGLPLFGRAYELSDRNAFDFGDKTKGAGEKGPYTKNPGFLAYFEICRVLQDGAKRYWNDEHKVPYLVSGDQWIGYDDRDSFMYKLDYIKKNGFGGAMVWAIGLDDFNNQCGDGNYPLMNAIHEKLGGSNDYQGDADQYPSEQRPTLNERPTQATPQNARPTQAPPQPTQAPPQATQAPPLPTQAPPQNARPTEAPPQVANPTQAEVPKSPEEICRQNKFGFFEHPDSCAKFIQCNFNSPVIKQCGPGTYWDQRIKNCNHQWAVSCKNKRGYPTKDSDIERSLIETLLRKLEGKMSPASTENKGQQSAET